MARIFTTEATEERIERRMNRSVLKGGLIGAATSLAAGVGAVAATSKGIGGPVIGVRAAMSAPLLMGATLPTTLIAAAIMIPTGVMIGATIELVRLSRKS